MSRIIRIITLIEDTAHKRRMLAEHGLAFWIETNSRRILFDTGQGMALFWNARSLNIHMESTNAIVISHGHYDHTGGLKSMLRTAPDAKVYAHPKAFQPKFVRNDDETVSEIGIPDLNDKIIRQQSNELILTTQPTEVINGVFATGQIPRATGFEKGSGPGFIDENCQQPDLLEDDQALFFESSQGLVVIFGCAHAGVVNTLQHIRQLAGGKPIHAVIGGMHLISASKDRIDKTIDAFRQLNVKYLAPAHCTGTTALARFLAAFPKKCFHCTVGTVISFELP